MDSIFKWDYNSDQPYPISDRAYKKSARRKHFLDIFGYSVNILVFPIAFLISKILFSKNKSTHNFFGIGINLDKNKEQYYLIQELDIDNLLIRIKLIKISNKCK